MIRKLFFALGVVALFGFGNSVNAANEKTSPKLGCLVKEDVEAYYIPRITMIVEHRRNQNYPKDARMNEGGWSNLQFNALNAIFSSLVADYVIVKSNGACPPELHMYKAKDTVGTRLRVLMQETR